MRDEPLPVARILLAAGAIAGAIGMAIAAALAILSVRHVPFGGAPLAHPAAIAVSQPEPSTLAEADAMLQSAPQPDLARYRAEKARALDELAWADAARTTAHVPIGVAMQMWAASAAAAKPREEPR